MEQTQCNRCEHKWYKRTPKDPKVCPGCKSPYWNKPRVYNLTTIPTPEVYSEDMTEIETTINDAIEGGWGDIHNKFILHEANKEIEFCTYFKEKELDYHGEPTEVGQHKSSKRVSLGIALLDPKFWQAACKTWGQPNTYKYTMTYFMSLRADGLTIEAALTKLR